MKPKPVLFIFLYMLAIMATAYSAPIENQIHISGAFQNPSQTPSGATIIGTPRCNVRVNVTLASNGTLPDLIRAIVVFQGNDPNDPDNWVSNNTNFGTITALGQVVLIQTGSLLLPTTNYSIHFRAENTDGTSPWTTGINFTTTSDIDIDGDTIFNCMDYDDDNDGQSDFHEILCGSNCFDPNSTSMDNDGDNIPDCADLDDDNDGFSDEAEIVCGSNPLDANQGCATLEDDTFSLSQTAILYPNPTKAIVTIKTGNLAIKEITVYSCLGKQVLTTKNNTIDISLFNPGLYLVKIESDTNAIIKKLIIE